MRIGDFCDGLGLEQRCVQQAWAGAVKMSEPEMQIKEWKLWQNGSRKLHCKVGTIPTVHWKERLLSVYWPQMSEVSLLAHRGWGLCRRGVWAISVLLYWMHAIVFPHSWLSILWHGVWMLLSNSDCIVSWGLRDLAWDRDTKRRKAEKPQHFLRDGLKARKLGIERSCTCEWGKHRCPP